MVNEVPRGVIHDKAVLGLVHFEILDPDGISDRGPRLRSRALDSSS
jgi:hypothetical protein